MENRLISPMARFGSLAKTGAKEYVEEAMSTNVLLALAATPCFCALQLFLLRRVASARSGRARMAWLMVKIPLWAAALFAAYALGGQAALSTFGLAAGFLYPVVSFFIYLRFRKGG